MTAPSVLEEFYRGFTDHERFCRTSLQIRNREGRVVPLDPLPAHRRLAEAVSKQRKRGRPVRICYLKTRRVGFSVGATSHLFHSTPFLSGQHAFVVSYVKRSAEEIFGYIEQYIQGYKPYSGLIRLPGLKAGTRGSKTKVEWENDSYMEVQTAMNVNVGRSFDVRHVLLDEFAFCANAAALTVSILPSVPDDADTDIVIGSTANGVGGSFYELCQKARAGESEYQFLFFGWWEHPPYRRDLELTHHEFEKSLTRNHPLFGDEFSERANYNLTPEQLNWRRWKIREICDLGGSLDTFRQEYPGNPEEAFISSGRPRFDHTALSRMPVIRDGVTGDVLIENVGSRQRVVFRGREDGRGPFTIYRRPETHGEYVIGADPSEGIDVRDGTPGNTDPDYAVASVLNRTTGEQVAKFRARMQPAAFAEVLHALGWFFNWAYLVPEANSSGLGTIEKLLELQYPLERIHKRRAAADVSGSTLLQYYGFKTDTVTRPQLVSALDDAIREQAIIIRDPNTLQECRTFVVKPNGKAEHAEQCHDDEVLALALAVIGLRFAPSLRPLGAAKVARPVPVRYGTRPKRFDDD